MRMDWWCEMSRLCITLSPFSPDYSGASAVFYDLNAVVVLHDASGCTGNYTGYDEPRWYGSQKAIYCSGLRELDAILGDDDKLVRRTLAAADCIRPEVIAVMGSPVPMVIGTDMTGIAIELEQSSGIPSFGFNTTGLKYYNHGVSQALLALAKRFSDRHAEKVRDSVNILGLTPLDYGQEENAEDLRRYLTRNGWQVLASFMMGGSLSEIKQAAGASVNLVVAQSGLELARWMEEQYAIPYVVYTPLGDGGEVNRYLREAAYKRQSRVVHIDADNGSGKLLIIGEQVMANSLRHDLTARFGLEGIVVGCLFGQDERLAQPHDLDLPDEAAIRQAMNERHREAIIADPLLQQLLKNPEKQRFYALPQVAVSSKLHWKEIPRYLSAELTDFMQTIAKETR